MLEYEDWLVKQFTTCLVKRDPSADTDDLSSKGVKTSIFFTLCVAGECKFHPET
jgi:hypothetical protein